MVNAKRRPPGRGSALSAAERTTIQGLALAGMSQSEISRQTGCGRPTVARVLSTAEFKAAVELARSVLASGAHRLAEQWLHAAEVAAKSGRHEPMRDALLGIRAIDPPSGARAQGEGFTVQIGIALPGLGPAATAITQLAEQGAVIESEE
jgi:hypothetical protein